MKPTQETDALFARLPFNAYAYGIARDLAQSYERLERERDEAREALVKAKSLLEHVLGDATIYYNAETIERIEKFLQETTK